MENSLDVNGLDIPIDKLVPLRERKINFNKNKSFKKILSSIKSIGIIEPLSVYAENDTYTILDGFLRYKACQKLSITEVPCIVEDTKEAYTYNSKVNRLSPVQEIKMLRKALKDKSIEESTIAEVFGIKSLRYRLGKHYMDKLHPQVIKAMDKNLISRRTAKEFIYVTKKRQMEIINEMKKVNDFTLSFVRALIMKTSEKKRAEKYKKSVRWKRKNTRKGLANKLKEVQERHTFYRGLYQQYTADLLKMCIYIRKMLSNERIRSYIAEKYPDILESFERIIFETVPEEEDAHTKRRLRLVRSRLSGVRGRMRDA